MANRNYNADSAHLPYTANRAGFFKTPNIPALCPTGTSPAIMAFVVPSITTYVGLTSNLPRRLLDHISVERKVSPSGNPTPISID